jgi:hypothetical protein
MATLDERILWAGLAVIVGIVADGTLDRAFARLEAAARTFGLPPDLFDELAARFDFHYYRPMDCYLSRQALAEARRIDGLALH